MIAARTLQSKEAIEQLAESGEDMSDIEVKASNAEKALSDIGVAVRDDKGAFRELEDVLRDVAGKWDNLNNTQQQMVSEQLAGNNRRNYFISLMEDYDRVMELQQQATNSTGAMMEAVDRQGESLEMVTNRLSNSMGALYDSLIDSEGLKAIIKLIDGVVVAFTKLNDFVGGGLLPTLGMLSGALVALKLDLSALTGQGIISGAITLFNQLSSAIAGLAVKANLAKLAMGGLFGLIGGLAIAGIGKLITHFQETAYSSEKAMDAVDKMGQSINEYMESVRQVNTQTIAVDDIEKAAERQQELNKNTQEYSDLQGTINTNLSMLAADYPDLAPIIENENIQLEYKIQLLKQQIEETKKLTAIEKIKDEGGTEQVMQMADNALRIVQERQLFQEALSQAMKAGVNTETGMDKNGEKWSADINGMTVYYEDLKVNIDRLTESLDMNETQFVEIMSTYKQLAQVGAITNDEFNTMKDKLFEIAGAMGWNSSAVREMLDNMDGAEKETNDLGDAAEDATGKIDRLNEAMNKTINDAGDVNEQYVQTLNYLEEAGELMGKIEDGIDLSDMNDMLDSDLMEDYAGSYDDVSSAIDHVKGKMGELQDKAYETYMNMQLADDDYWKQAVTSCADALGVNADEFAAYVDSKGGMREVDVTNAENATEAENQANTDLVRQGLLNYAGYVTGKGDNRKTDMKNVTEFLNTQGAKEAQTIDQLAKMWSDYYNAKKRSINAEISQAKAMQGWAGDPTKRKTSAEMEQLQADIAALERANTMMTNYFGSVSTTFKDIGSGLSQSAANAGKAINDAIGSGYKAGKANGGKGSSGKGSSGKGSGSSTAKEAEDMESLVDRYYEFDDALRNVDKQLNKVRAERENITSSDEYEKSVKKEISLINQQIKAMKNIQKEYQAEQKEIQKTLKNKGFKFDKNGDITNYEKQLEKLTKQANKLTNADAKKAAQEQVKAIAELIERYNELNDETIPDVDVTIAELQKDITDLTNDLYEQTEAIEGLGEAYYKLNREISDVDHALDMNEAKQQHASGQEQIDLLEEQIDLLKQRQDLNKQQQKNAQDEADSIRKQLSAQGVKFNNEGEISNYDQLIQQLTKNANKLVGDDKEEAVQDIEDLIDLMDKYTTLTDETIPDLQLDWQDYQNSIEDVKETLADLHQEQVENATDMQKQVSEAYEHYLTERYNKVKEALKKEQEEYNKAYEEENFERGLADEQRKLDEIAQQIAIYERDMSAAGQAKLAQLRAEYEAQRNAMNDIIRENEHEQTNEDFSDQEQALDDALADALDPAKLVQVVNDAIGSGLITIGDQVIELDDLMTTWLDETGDGLYTIGDTLKSELLDNLEVAKEILTEMGLTNGSGIDLFTNAQGLLTHAKPTNAMTSSVTFSAPLLYVEGNVDEGSVAELTAELQRMEQRIYENIADSMK